MGAQKEAYELLVPSESFIHIDDFKDPKSLANHLHSLDQNDREYFKYFAHLGTGQLTMPSSVMCRTCDLVNFLLSSDQNERHYSNDELKEFWTPEDCNLNGIKRH